MIHCKNAKEQSMVDIFEVKKYEQLEHNMVWENR